MMPDADAKTQTKDFLFEIGTEELPAAAAVSALRQAASLAAQSFSRRDITIDPEQIKVWITPRRITVYIESVSVMQPEREIAERGPVASKAFDDEGKPSKAAEGFARAKKVTVDELEVRDYEGQKFVFAVHRQEGRPTVQMLPGICEEILTGISFPKTMRWDGADLRFSRPVRWLLSKFGDQTVEFEVAGLISGGDSRGHRFLGQSRVAIAAPAAYKQVMADNRVMVDQEERRQVILEGLATESGKLGASFTDPAGELQEVVYLVENPTVHAGRFAEEHLHLPARVLITCMQSHQRYFPLTAEDGSLMAGFLYVMNGDPQAAAAITEGNERVLEGRIEDAEFSFEQDLKIGIENMREKLGNVVFHGLLGSLADKTARIGELVEALAANIGVSDPDLQTATTAARFAKADQVSTMVQEFSDLEGYIGSVYANMEGYTAEICTAIEEHYLPVSAGGELPSTVPGALLSIADKIDSLVGAFAVDELPTGSRDPYGLRRAAIGISEISSRYDFDFDLHSLLASAHHFYLKQKADISREPQLISAVYQFVCDRIQQRLVEKGIPVEIVEAARSAAPVSTIALISLSEALNEFRADPLFEDLHTAYFRLSKIAAKYGAGLEGIKVDKSLFESGTETELFDAFNRLESELNALVNARDYRAALRIAAPVRAIVDRFFDDVLVMAPDEKIKNNRLVLVSQGAGILLKLGDPMRVAAVAV